MIPIFSILCVLISFSALICFLKLHFTYRKNKEELVGKFSKIFLFLSLLYGSFALPRFVFNDLRIIELCLDLGFFFAFLAAAYFLLISFELFYQKKPSKFIFLGVISIGVLFLILSIINPRPASIHFYNGFVFWSENRNIFINIFGGTILGLITIIGASLFIRGGLKSEEKKVRVRAFLMSGAIIGTFLGAVIRFVFGFLFDIFISTLIGVFFGIISMLLMIIAIFGIKIKKKKYFKKIY